jgi:ABC-type phosphate/phosphonate transport system substrate-binding protein
MNPLIVGAVLYDPKVSVIWDIIREFFEANGCPIDVVFYTNYELQNTALLDGHLDLAWNSPLAWVDAVRRSRGHVRAIAMRDTDRDRVSHLLVKNGSGIESVANLQGRTIAFGAKDSPQARLIPQGLLLRHGLAPGRDYVEQRHDILVGKHGDHIGGEKEALLSLKAGTADACALIDLNWLAWSGDGTADPGQFTVLATTDRYDHCVFTVKEDLPPEREKRWLDVLFSMSYDNPLHREMMDLEGLKKWEPGRTSGFAALTEATEGLGYFDQPS